MKYGGVSKYHLVSESRSTAIYERVLYSVYGYFMDFHQNIRNEGSGGYQCTTWGSGKIIDVRQVDNG